MEFVMQASNPRTTQAFNDEDEDLMDALQTVFPMYAEDAYMAWHWVRVPLSYKYTISYMIDDALRMLEELMGHRSGQIAVNWFVSEFTATWHMNWDDDQLEIRAEWTSAPCLTQGLLQMHPTAKLAKSAFVAEWKPVLGVVLEALTQAGYRENHLMGLAQLRRIHDAIPKPGILYREADEYGDAT